MHTHRPLQLRGGTPPNPTKAGSIVLVALNVRGANSAATWDKWKTIIRSMLSKKIAILSILESHSDNEQIKKLNSQYSPNLHFTHTSDPQNPRSKGIVIVMNKNKINSIPSNFKSISPGRAISFMLNWPEENKINVLAMYAPNTPNENTEFWNEILTKTENEVIPPTNIMIGDLNMVEDAMDRIPAHPDPTPTVESLLELKKKLGLIDSWHQTNPPPDCGYTFEQPSRGSRLCIDRIYITDDIFS